MKTRIIKGHSVLREAFKESLGRKRESLVEATMDSFRKKELKNNSQGNNTAEDKLYGDTDLTKALSSYQKYIQFTQEADKNVKLVNYAKRYNRLMALIEYLTSIYKEKGYDKITKKEAAEVVKTYHAADNDLEAVLEIIDRNTYIDRSHEARWYNDYVRKEIYKADKNAREMFNKFQKVIDAEDTDEGMENLAKKRRQRMKREGKYNSAT